MAQTLSKFRNEERLAQEIANLKKQVAEIRSNQAQRLSFVDIVLDGTAEQGIVIIGSTNKIYFQSRSGGGVDFFRSSDNLKIASLDMNGNLKCRGTITQNTTP